MEPQLYLFLKELDAAAKRKVKVVALGGNVMVTLGFRNATMDVDLCVKKRDMKLVKDVSVQLIKGQGISSHILVDGDFVTFRIPDFWERAMPYDTEFKHVELRLLNLNDVLLCKIDRNLEADSADVATLMTRMKEKIDWPDLKSRFPFYLSLYTGHPERKQEFVQNFDAFLKQYEGTQQSP
jgi:hypothetical protein